MVVVGGREARERARAAARRDGSTRGERRECGGGENVTYVTYVTRGERRECMRGGGRHR